MSDEQLHPPASWDKFEEICADLFSRLWNDPELVRYGRSGQRQKGVDIYGKQNGADSGVQCKGKRVWPPTKLTIAEIDAEIAEAKKFRPTLKTYIIATTADNDVAVTDHVNAISEKHVEEGLFRVTVFGWRELTRRIDDFPDLKEKHFDIITLRQIRRSMPGEIAERVVEELKNANIVIPAGADHATQPKPNILDEGLAEAIERDVAHRYERALQRSIFPELSKQDELAQLAVEIIDTKGSAPSSGIRRTILLRAARSAAARGNLTNARIFLTAGQNLSGADSDAPARARLAVAEGNINEAIQILRDLSDADSRSVLLSILAKDRGEDQAVAWMTENKVSPAQLTASGIFTLCTIYLKKGDLDSVSRVLAQVTPAQFKELPYLHFLRGAISFARLLPVTEQATALSGLPLDVRNARPVIGGHELSVILDAAIDDFREALPYAITLSLTHAPRLIQFYIRWCELLHPTRKQAALAQLRSDMDDNARAVANVQYAFAYLEGYSPTALESYLQRRDALGGLNDEELRAAFVISLNKNDASGLASLIAAKRQQAEISFGRNGILLLEIQALAKSGDATSAKIVLEDNLELFDSGQVASFRAEIAKAEGADPVAEHLRLYEEEKTPETLRALVDVLVSKKDHVGIAKYAKLLFATTKDPRDIALAAEAEMRAGLGDDFVRTFDLHPSLQDHPPFLRYYAWQLFRLGRVRETKAITERIEKNDAANRDLQLEAAIAIETGEWESLAGPLAATLDPSQDSDGLTLIRAAHLSQASSQGPLMDLITAAIAKGGDDPNVLLGGYFLYVEQGIEEERAESHEWFRKALALSGPDGPLQSFEIKDLLAQQTDWDQHTRFVSAKVVAGEFPLAVAAPGLRTTLVDIVLRNLIRNAAMTDARRKVALPLFAGNQLPTPPGLTTSLALDISALLVLGWLGILPLILATFPKVILPGGVFAELFEGRRRIRRGQKTRLRKSIEIREAIAKGQIKVLRSPALVHDALSAEIGVELSALLREAKAADGIVIRPAPIARVGLAETGDADMSAHEDRLSDMHSLLKVLADQNAIDEEAEKSAKQYFALQDKMWASSAIPDPARPVYLDGLALAYLQYTGLLPAFLRTFSDVYIHQSTEEEANALIEDDLNVAEVFRVIDDIRSAVRQANAAGHVTFGARRAQANENDFDGMQSSLNLISDLTDVDAVAIDDRALNKEPFAADTAGRRARLVTTLDLIEELRARGALTEERCRALRYRLRSAGAMLMPVTASELAAAARRNRQNEAPEFKAIRDSLDLARVSETPQFPGEMRWFMSYVQATRISIARIWNEEPDEQRARILATAIFNMRIVPEDWLGRWGDHPPPNWVDAVRSALLGGFAVPVEIGDDEKIAAYQKWLDDVVMADIRSLSPELYQRVVIYLRSFALTPWSKDEEDAEDESE